MKKTGRTILLIIALVIATVLFYPTIKWYFFTPEETKDLALMETVRIRDYAAAEAGKDVRFLMSVMKKDRNAELPSEYSYLMKGNVTIYEALSQFPSEKALLEEVEKHYRDEIMGAKKLSGRVLNLGLDLRGGMSVLLEADRAGWEEKHGETLSDAALTALLQEDIEILTARIDQFGVSEPDIRLQGGNQILIELPGEADPERVNAFLRGKGSLAFHLVDQRLTDKVNEYYGTHPSEAFNDDGTVHQPSFIPAGYEVVGCYEEDEYGLDTLRNFTVISEEPALDGSHLERAEVGRDARTQRPSVNFQLDGKGGSIFYDFTSAHVGEPMAIVMDGRAKSVARINDAISSSVELSGAFSEREAESIAITLKTSALPLDLDVVNEQTVGASLGDDAVSVALRTILVGFLLVVIFMVAWYGPAGFVADIALFLNLYLMLSVLSALSFTLTLTSIAGLVLTLGMAIDANVIIFERIKDELRSGEKPFDALRAGYSRAFWTIMDSNITTIIAAVVLSVLGSASVKGFANTLAVGLACSLFTSLFASHLFFDFLVKDEFSRGVRLSWRKRK